MSEPFMGEIKIVSFNFAPRGWAECNGQFLPINQNQALFSLFGTTYGGNGQTTFALPNLRGQVPIHYGSGFTQGEAGGTSAVTINQSTTPTHNHPAVAANASADSNDPTGRYLGAAAALYHSATNLTPLFPSTLTNLGGSQPHNNMMPYLVLNFIVALQGIFPSQT